MFCRCPVLSPAMEALPTLISLTGVCRASVFDCSISCMQDTQVFLRDTAQSISNLLTPQLQASAVAVLQVAAPPLSNSASLHHIGVHFLTAISLHRRRRMQRCGSYASSWCPAAWMRSNSGSATLPPWQRCGARFWAAPETAQLHTAQRRCLRKVRAQRCAA